MSTRGRFVIAVALPLLAACTPVAEYSDSEAVNQLTLDRTTASYDFRFVPGTDQLLPGDATRLRRLAAAGAITRSDRIAVTAAGGPELAAARSGIVAAELLPYGIVVTGRLPGTASPDHAVVTVGRTLVRLPDCPNWSKQNESTDFTNTVASNFGCATVTNLGRMVANPTDLASGQALGFAQGNPAVAAVGRYQADAVELPPPSGPDEPISAPAPGKAAPGAVGGGATASADVSASK